MKDHLQGTTGGPRKLEFMNVYAALNVFLCPITSMRAKVDFLPFGTISLTQLNLKKMY